MQWIGSEQIQTFKKKREKDKKKREIESPPLSRFIASEMAVRMWKRKRRRFHMIYKCKLNGDKNLQYTFFSVRHLKTFNSCDGWGSSGGGGGGRGNRERDKGRKLDGKMRAEKKLIYLHGKRLKIVVFARKWIFSSLLPCSASARLAQWTFLFSLSLSLRFTLSGNHF